MPELIAIKRCGKFKEGTTFKEGSAVAKALVALGHAEYKTKVMVAEEATPPVPPSTPVVPPLPPVLPVAPVAPTLVKPKVYQTKKLIE